jgi:hypothetical protein
MPCHVMLFLLILQANPSLPLSASFACSNSGSGLVYAHLAQLRLGTTGNLLGAQGNELLLQLIELLLEIILVLAPKLLGSDLAGRLPNPPSALPPHSRYLRAVKFTIVNDCRVWRVVSRCRGSRVAWNRRLSRKFVKSDAVWEAFCEIAWRSIQSGGTSRNLNCKLGRERLRASEELQGRRPADFTASSKTGYDWSCSTNWRL